MSQIQNEGFKPALSSEGDDLHLRPSVTDDSVNPAFLKGSKGRLQSDGITVKVESKKRCSDCNKGAYWYFISSYLKWRKCNRCLTPLESDIIIHTYFTLGKLDQIGVN